MTLADGYRRHGLLMYARSANWPDGSVSTEAGIKECDERERTGRLKFAAHLSELLEERRYYHRKDGQIVKVRDDILSAVRIFLMMKRFCKNVGLGEAAERAVGPVMAGGAVGGVDWDLWSGGAL